MRICLVSRELYPYVGGGIAPIVAATARQLSEIAEVAVVTSANHAEAHRRLGDEEDPRVLPREIAVLCVEEPGEAGYGAAYTYMHAYSARVHDVLREHYGDHGPDLIEFPDYLGEGFVTVQAKHTGARWLAETTVAVRLHTSCEICAVLDARLPDDFATRALFDAERYALRHADCVLWSGGSVLETYERFYGADELAPAIRVRDAFLADHAINDDQTTREPLGASDRPMRLLYVGRLERRKGVQNLLRALDGLGPREDWTLTLLGEDTNTGPVGTSMRDNFALMVEGDTRVTLADPLPREDVPSFIQSHDVVVIPSLWECWPNVGRETLMLGRPLFVTPVGGLVDMAVPGRSGWIAPDATPEGLITGLEMLLQSRAEVDALIERQAPQQVFAALTDVAALRDGYRRLCREKSRLGLRLATAPGDRKVTVVVPYYRLEAHVEETIASVEAQTWRDVEIIVVNDGSLREEDRLLFELEDAGRIKLLTQPNSGLGQARNVGFALATGAFVLPLDADDTIEPTFVERCVEALAANPELVYVTTWAQFMDGEGVPFGGSIEGYMPYGNWSALIRDANVGGTCSAVFRRRVLELGFRYPAEAVSYEDWMFFWDLHRAGHLGAVVPERLFNYRVRARSMMRSDGAPLTGVLHEELRAVAREHEILWTTTTRA